MAGLVGHADSGYVHDKVFCDGRKHAQFLAQFGSKKNIQPGGKYYLPPGSTDCQPGHIMPLTGSHDPKNVVPVPTTVDERRKLIAKVGGIVGPVHKVACGSVRKGAPVQKRTVKWDVPWSLKLAESFSMGFYHAPDHQDTCVVQGAVAMRTQLTPNESVGLEEAAIVAKARSLGLQAWVDAATGKLQVEDPKKPTPKEAFGGTRTITVPSVMGTPNFDMNTVCTNLTPEQAAKHSFCKGVGDTGMVHDGAANMSAKPMHSLPMAPTALDAVNAVQKQDQANIDAGMTDVGASHEKWLGPNATLKGITAHNARVQSGKMREATDYEMGDDGSPPLHDGVDGYVLGQNTLKKLDMFGLGTIPRGIQSISEASSGNPHTKHAVEDFAINGAFDAGMLVLSGGASLALKPATAAAEAAVKTAAGAAMKTTTQFAAKAVTKTLESVIGKEAARVAFAATEKATVTVGNGVMVPIKYGGKALTTAGSGAVKTMERGISKLPLSGVKNASDTAIKAVSTGLKTKAGRLVTEVANQAAGGVIVGAGIGAATGAFDPHEDHHENKPPAQDYDFYSVDDVPDISSDPHGRLHVGGSHQPDKPGPTKLVGKDSSNTYLIGALLAGGMLVAASA